MNANIKDTYYSTAVVGSIYIYVLPARVDCNYMNKPCVSKWPDARSICRASPYTVIERNPDF